jgi:8-oxo-dGTP diphosphatase
MGENMSEYLQVAAAVIKDGDKIMIAKRAEGKVLGGMWEFPGGKIEEGETGAEALKRELKEEFDVDAKIGDFIMSVKHTYPKVKIELHAYFVEIVDGEFKLIDHTELEFLEPSKMCPAILAPADVPILDKLKGV